MLDETIGNLNTQYALGQHIRFAEGPGGLPIAEIRNGLATATVALQGAHVLAFQPHGQQPALFVSRSAIYRQGQAIRGGIPVCWPWFAQHPTDPTLPMHGFARTSMWQVVGTAVIDDATQLRLGLTDTEATWQLWPHPFALELDITVGRRLRAELIARNTGDEPFSCGGALHTYFRVGDVTKVAVHGLEGCAYLDKTEGYQQKTQQGPVTIGAETDRIYLDTTAECVIDDPSLGRRIRVAKSGSHTTVVWNPWAEKARAIGDFEPSEYLEKICVETANANNAGDAIDLPPGGEHRLGTTIEVES
jgi:D-hexose-6-phosphate mutarotase